MTWHLSDRNKTNSISNCQRLGHIHALKRQIIPKCYLHLATFSVFPDFIHNHTYSRYYLSTLRTDPGQRHLMRTGLGSDHDLGAPECLTCPEARQNTSSCSRSDSSSDNSVHDLSLNIAATFLASIMRSGCHRSTMPMFK